MRSSEDHPMMSMEIDKDQSAHTDNQVMDIIKVEEQKQGDTTNNWQFAG